MATHTIMLPSTQDDTFRSIVWDDVAGTFSGDHRAVPWLNKEASRAEPEPFVLDDCSIVVQDPGHDPADLLRLLTLIWQGAYPPGKTYLDLTVELPPVFDGVEPTPVIPGGAMITWPDGETTHLPTWVYENGKGTRAPQGSEFTMTGEKDEDGLSLTTDGRSLRFGLF
ncbi:MAG: hypothetical protein GDA49_12560 [Rhodospirillales bacterium]|nr:hypothetical protein [Rhodospirillales bacterium]